MRDTSRFFIIGLLLLGFIVQVKATDKVVLLDDNRMALKARIELVKNAEKEILLTTYIFSNDEISKYILAELQEAVDRGVEVKMIIDASSNYVKPKTLKYLSRLGIETKLYNRLKGYNLGKFLKYRLHAKVLLVDGKKLIIGGRNIGGEYFGLNKLNYRDRDIYIEGASALEIRTYFFNFFESKFCKKVEIRRFWSCFNSKKLCERKELKLLNDLFVVKDSIASSKLYLDLANCDWKEDILDVDTISFYYNSPIPKKKKDDLFSKVYLEAIESGVEGVIIETPYFVLFDELATTLQNSLDNKTKVRVLTNSIYSTDGMLAHSGYNLDKEEILSLGAELYEYHGMEKLHTKTLVADNLSILGSVNLDPRSFQLNKEIFVKINSEIFAKKLMLSISKDLDLAVPVNTGFKPLKEKSIFKKISVGFLQIFVTPRIKYLL